MATAPSQGLLGGGAGGGYYNTATYTGNAATQTATIWAGWAGTLNTSSSTTTIWSYWSGQQGTPALLGGGLMGGAGGGPAAQAPQANRDDMAAYTEQYNARLARIDSAVNRARALLEEHLSSAQLASLKAHRHFIVKGGKTGKLYVITTQGIAGNIYEIGSDYYSISRYCCHANDNEIPAADHWLTQKLWLEHCEDEFLARANKSSYGGHRFAA